MNVYRKGMRRLFFLALMLSGAYFVHGQNKSHPPRNVVIKAITGVQYDVVRFRVAPGERIKLIMRNESDMSHNLLIVKPGSRLQVVNAALQLAENGPRMNYIPGTAGVLWTIPLVSPGQTKSVTFTAPVQPGIYPYVCTYPGHGFVMYGAMYVTRQSAMPDIKRDINVPPSRRHEDKTNKNDQTGKAHQDAMGKMSHADDDQIDTLEHPYPLTPPYLYHAFIDGVSPAAVAVRLPQALSYCWDAYACRLALAWKGGFVDMHDLWKGHFNASAKILGDIFFRDHTDYPIRLTTAALVPDTVQYNGYRLINGYPEFHYRLNGMDIYELIKEKADGNGLILSFRIPRAEQTVWFFTARQDDGIRYESSRGKWKDGKLVLSPEEAKTFTITMTSYYLIYKNTKK